MFTSAIDFGILNGLNYCIRGDIDHAAEAQGKAQYEAR
ncbi:hypothetical protein SAMN05216366_1555 [Selenomonas ruminantium]|uniref:Uncharacterized protein n=1 Tax=Selenomonas ruminantium TaxID=971 RepID=A0A1H0VGK1_SELRU|nr:hypothetical protein SAMN05216366_1555 [Selenomonas ruminantium]